MPANKTAARIRSRTLSIEDEKFWFDFLSLSI